MTTTRPTSTSPDTSFDRRLVPPMMLGAILNPINTSIIAVALVPIGRALGAPASQTAWLVSALYLTTAIGQPVVGRLVDVHGPRRLFLAGSALVGLGGLLGTVAPNLAVLVAARVVLGLGTCAGYPAAMALIRGEAQRTGHDSPQGVLTVLAVSSQTISVIGPTLGGLLIGIGGWRATFAVNLPLALVSIALAWRRLPHDLRPADEEDADPAATVRHPLDVLGIVLFAATLTALLLFLMEPSVPDLALLVLAAALAALFVRRERRAPDPFLDLRVLGGNGPLILTYVRQLLSGLTMYAVLYGVAQWLQEGRGLGATAAGLMLLPLSGAALLVSASTGRRPEIKAKLVVGAAFQVVGAAALLLLHGDTAIWVLVLVVVAFGIPQGLLNLGNQNAVYHQAEGERIGSSAGLLRTAMYLGAIAAAATISAVFGPRADTPGLHALAWVLLGASVVLLGTTVLDRSLGAVGAPTPEDPSP